MKTPKKKLLLVSAVPPPFSGPEVMTQHLLDGGLDEEFEVVHFNIGKKRGIETKGVFNGQNLIYGFFQPFILFVKLLRGNFDVVFTDIAQNSAGFLRYSSFIWIASLFPCAIVTRVMGDGFGHFYDRVFFKDFILATLKRIDRLIVRAEVLKTQFLGLVPQEKISIVYSGISLDEWSAPSRKEGVIRYLFVGYLTKAKGAFEFLRAVKKIKAKVPEAEFVFVGPRVESKEHNILYLGDPETERDQGELLDEIIEKEGLEGLVQFRGTLSGSDKVNEYLAADVFVFPSYAEAFPTVVLEAMAAELPVVTTRVGALPELFGDEDLCYVERGSVRSIEETCVVLARDSERRLKLGKAGRQRVENSYDVATYVKATSDVLAGVLSDGEAESLEKLPPQTAYLPSEAPLNLAFFGHYGGKNTGDEAMLEALLEQYGNRKLINCRVLGKAGSSPSRWPRVSFRTTSALELLRAVWWSGVFCIGGGTHFHDDYTNQRYRRHFLYMARLALTGYLTRILGKRFVMVGAGIGPLRRQSAIQVTRAAVRAANVTVARDQQSLDEIHERVKKEEGILGFDLVALLEVPKNTIKDKSRVGISVAYSKSFSIEGITANQWWTRFSEELIELGKKKPELIFRVIVFRGGTRESDQELSEQLHRQLRESLGDARVELFSYNDNPLVMLAGIAECGSIIATRYHAALMGFVAESSLMFLCYHRKLFDLASEVELSQDACIDFRTEEGRVTLRAALEELVAETTSFYAQRPPESARLSARKNLDESMLPK